MDLQLKEKVYIVTGGSSGIGEGITRALVAEGAHVVIATRSVAEVSQQFLDDVGYSENTIVTSFGDLCNTEVCKQAVHQAVAAFGRLDGIVNNAGINDGAGLVAGPGAFRTSLKNNLYHYFDLVHYGLPYLKESKGAIVNISSKVALTGQGGTSGYAAAKGAILALTREWAAELAPYSIRVNAVLPAEVMTPLYRHWLDTNFSDPAEQEAKIAGKIPLEQRMTTTEEIASMVVFLLSPKSGHTTGQFMIVDGGYVHLDRSIT